MKSRVKAVCISAEKGRVKIPSGSAVLLEGKGLEGDAHASGGDRQVSLIFNEDISKDGADIKVPEGSFAENLIIEGKPAIPLEPGRKLVFSSGAELQVTKVGKDCAEPCRIYYDAGFCPMSSSGIFARVLKGGRVQPGDTVEFL